MVSDFIVEGEGHLKDESGEARVLLETSSEEFFNNEKFFDQVDVALDIFDRKLWRRHWGGRGAVAPQKFVKGGRRPPQTNVEDAAIFWSVVMDSKRACDPPIADRNQLIIIYTTMKRRRDLKQQSIGAFFSGPAAKKSRDHGARLEARTAYNPPIADRNQSIIIYTCSSP